MLKFLNTLLIGFLRWSLVNINKKSICLSVIIRNVLDISFFLRYTFLLKNIQLIDIICVDLVRVSNRFIIVYSYLSRNVRIKVYTYTDRIVFSIVSLFNSANWLEREIWDMFGVRFLFHPDLRRILTNYGFKGWPLRKDFPLTGFVETRYDEKINQLITERVNFSQKNRSYKKATFTWKKGLIIAEILESYEREAFN